MESYLLDTHVLLWMASNSALLSDKTKEILKTDSQFLFSYASIWEMSIKIKSEKLKLSFPLQDFMERAIQEHALVLHEISLAHIYHTQTLPLHHRDPFDRLIIAQAVQDNLIIVSADDLFDNYGVKRCW